MKIEIEDIDSCRRRLRVSAEAGEIALDLEDVTEEFAKTGRIPGFRPGKAPLKMVERRYGTEIAVKKAFLKTDSIGKILTLELPFSRHTTRKIKIKIDTNPPAGSSFKMKYIDLPLTSAITTQTLKSGFATKSHTLLCREYTKGRDWYDFL